MPTSSACCLATLFQEVAEIFGREVEEERRMWEVEEENNEVPETEREGEGEVEEGKSKGKGEEEQGEEERASPIL